MQGVDNEKPRGFALWIRILKPEKNFYIVTFIYACAISLLSLAIPISIQALVNTVTFAVLKQPLIIVSLLLLALLGFSGMLRGLQDYAIEYFQRHFFARATLEISQHIMNAKEESLQQVYRGDLINRFFEIDAVKKAVSKILAEGVALVLQTIVGMLLLAFYHPYFLAFDIVLAGLLALVWILFGQKAMDSAIKESKAKYKVAAWLEQLTQTNKLFKSLSGRAAAKKRTDGVISHYLEKRGIHFKYLFRQIIMLLGIYAFLSALILGLGGFLVMEGQLTLGQLVAAEIVVAVILSGFAKAGDYLESVYDVHASLDKLADFIPIQTENPSGDIKLDPKEGNIVFDDVHFERAGSRYSYNQVFEVGKNYLITEDFDSTQRAFLELINAEVQPRRGRILFGEYNITNVCPYAWRDEIYIIDNPKIIEGSVEKNLSWGIENYSEAQINEALDLVGLSELIGRLPEKTDTILWPEAGVLSVGEIIRLDLARAIMKKPSWVVISSVFYQVPTALQEKVLSALKDKGIGVLVWSAGIGTQSSSFDEAISFSRNKIEGGSL